jgi:hypothetical protein
MEWILLNWGSIVQGVLMIVGGASLLAKLTPTKKDDIIIDSILKLINGIALNPKKKKARD